MRTLARVFAAASFGAALVPSLAEAKVHITVDLDRQTIHVEAKDQVFDWKVSSGKPGYDTPAGKFGVLWMDKDHHSDEYEGAFMPDSIFFAPGFAIHGFGKSPWGHKASHGCVRLPVAKAEILFGLVKDQGADVNIIGASDAVIASTSARRQDDTADGDAYNRGETPDDRGYASQDYRQSRERQDYARPAYGADSGAPSAGRAGQSDSLFGSVY